MYFGCVCVCCVAQQYVVLFICMKSSLFWHVGPLTENDKPPSVKSLIQEEILKKPVNLQSYVRSEN